MTLITADFYTDTYCSGCVYSDPYELPALIQIASDIVNSICRGKIYSAFSLDLFPEFVMNNIKLAVCAEAAYLERNGGLSSLDSSAPVQMSLGKFSYMYTRASNAIVRKCLPVSPLAVSYLEHTGLLYRGI